MNPAFAVDLDQLDDVVASLAGCQRRLEDLGVDLDRQVRLLHAEWTGLAADAQDAAHREWAGGLRAMHTALGSLAGIAAAAHDAYARAAATNLAMWQSTEA